MMFGALDDLDGRVALIVRDAEGDAAEALEADKVVVVRGRVDHKGRGDTSIVVSEAERFEPAPDDLAAARARAEAERDPEQITLQVSAAEFGPSLVDELKALFAGFPGETEVVLAMRTREGQRRLRFGPDYRVKPSQPLRAQIDELLGPEALVT
jgi:DNA polymerase-3 subunit alpha